MLKILVLLVSATLPVLVQAADNQFNTRVGLEVNRSDNVNRRPEGQSVGDLIYRPTLGIDYQFNLAKLAANLSYQSRQERYRDGNFRDRVTTTGTGQLDWTILDRRLSWELYQNQNTTVVDALELDTPTNETDRSVFRTGPTLTFISGKSALSLTSIWTQTRFTREQFVGASFNGTEQLSHVLSYNRRLSPRLSLGLSGEYRDVDFDSQDRNYDSTRILLDIGWSGKVYSASLSAGSSRTDSVAEGSRTNPYISFLASRQWRNSTWRLSGIRQITDASNGLSGNRNQLNPLNNGDSNFNRQGLVERRRLELSYQHSFVAQRIRASLNLSADETEYQSQPFSEDRIQASAQLNYAFSRKISISYQFNYVDVDRTRNGVDQNSRDDRQQFNFNFKVNQNLNLVAYYRETDRILDTRGNYVVNETGITITYAF